MQFSKGAAAQVPYAGIGSRGAIKRLPQLDEGASVCLVKGDGMQAQQAAPPGVVLDDRGHGPVGGALDIKKAALLEKAQAIARETVDPAQRVTAERLIT